MAKIGFLDRICWPKGANISERCHALGVITEWYFDVGQKCYDVRQISYGDAIPLRKAQKKKLSVGDTIARVMAIFLKVVTYLTLVIPALMFVAKLIYRKTNQFEIFNRIHSPSPGTGPIQKDLAVRERTLSQCESKPDCAKPLKNQSRQPVSSKTKQLVQHYVQADFSNEVLSNRIGMLRGRVQDFEFDDTTGPEMLYRLYTDLICQELNYRLILEQHGRFLEGEQVEKLSQARVEISHMIESLTEKIKSDNTVVSRLKIVEKELEVALEAISEGNSILTAEEACDRYLKFASIIDKLGVRAKDNGKVYDIGLYQRVESRLKPMPLRNHGNTCFLNAALQMLLAVPFFKKAIYENLRQLKQRRPFDDESNEEYRTRIEKDDQDFVNLSKRLKTVHQHFKAIVNAFHKNDRSAINQALKNLNQALGKARCYDGRLGQQHDAVQPVEALLSIIDYSIELVKVIRYASEETDEIEKIKRCRPGMERCLRLKLKEYLDEEIYATSFQGLVDHHFRETKMYEETTFDGDSVAEWHEKNLLQNKEDFLVVNLDRTGITRPTTTGKINQGKHAEDVKFADGEIIDFTCAFDPKILAEGERVKYEVAAVAFHHGSSHRAGHWTASVKKGGKWYICDDSKPINSIGIANPFLGNGTLYIFKRVI